MREDAEEGYEEFDSGVRLDGAWAAELGEELEDPEEVVMREPTMRVLIDYPLHHPTTVTLRGDAPGGGFTSRGLLEGLRAEYSRIYAEEEAASPVPDRSGSKMYNR